MECGDSGGVLRSAEKLQCGVARIYSSCGAFAAAKADSAVVASEVRTSETITPVCERSSGATSSRSSRRAGPLQRQRPRVRLSPGEVPTLEAMARECGASSGATSHSSTRPARPLQRQRPMEQSWPGGADSGGDSSGVREELQSDVSQIYSSCRAFEGPMVRWPGACKLWRH